VWASGWTSDASHQPFYVFWQWDGSSWSTAKAFPNSASSPEGNGIWGASANDVWFVGHSIVHYDGSTFTTAPVPGDTMLLAVWGSSASDVWAVGESGTILHYDGTAWSPRDSGTSHTLSAVWGFGRHVLVGGGAMGTILRNDH
jgi:hypothetical protein